MATLLGHENAKLAGKIHRQRLAIRQLSDELKRANALLESDKAIRGLVNNAQEQIRKITLENAKLRARNQHLEGLAEAFGLEKV